ncbi:MAG TPA: hypothetical protein IAB27_04480 [Candidatus Coprosoma intestinipullorum]|uniref:Uncharacterized protein n=1 Tax=Candidatus Coprosoma intestinipullorum TaxID=2840752 RepID=A0A9D0ZQZ9_9FIRM|nr:hypothetical protein [Candidatus Coprosoma intestinipullorum]
MREKEIRPANKILIIIISLLAILATLLWINYILIKPNTVATVQTLEEIKLKSVVQNHLLFSDIKITEEKGEYIVTSKVTNLTSNILSLSPITMTFRDSDKNEIASITSYLGSNITEEASKTLYIKTNVNLLEARSVDVEVQTNL